MLFWKVFYNLLIIPLLTLFALAGSLFHAKLRQGTLGRLKTVKLLKIFSKTLKSGRDVYWFHAASFGEFEQIRPVLKGLKEIVPECIVVVSFFSPSGFNNVIDENLDCKIYLPFDYPWLLNKVFTIVKPKKLILASYDVWPNLIWTAKKMGIHSTLFAARFSKGTSKLLPIVNSFYRSVYSCFSAIYTITEADHAVLQGFLYPTGRPIVRTLGNPRYDQVKTSADKFTKERTESVLLRQKRLIAGSVHSEDNQVILDSIISLLKEVHDLSLLWIPHEPTERVVKAAESVFSEVGFSVTRLGSAQWDKLNKFRVIIVDSVGKLSTLYWEAQIAYVGGGFSSGVHNVMEPAIARLPVFFGPRFKNSHEADELIKSRGGFTISTGAELFLGIKQLLVNREDFLKVSFAATNVIHRNLGSSTRVVRNLIHD